MWGRDVCAALLDVLLLTVPRLAKASHLLRLCAFVGSRSLNQFTLQRLADNVM